MSSRIVDRPNAPQSAAPAASKRRTAIQRSVAPNSFRLGYLIHDVSRMRRTLFDQHMKPEGITRSQWWILANISRHSSDGIMSTELAKLLDVGKVTLGGLISRLETAGYVYRRANKQDGRAKHIFITQAGYSLIDRMKIIAERLNKEICEGMSGDDVEIVERQLNRIKGNLRQMLAETGGAEETGADIDA